MSQYPGKFACHVGLAMNIGRLCGWLTDDVKNVGVQHSLESLWMIVNWKDVKRKWEDSHDDDAY